MTRIIWLPFSLMLFAYKYNVSFKYSMQSTFTYTQYRDTFVIILINNTVYEALPPHFWLVYTFSKVKPMKASNVMSNVALTAVGQVSKQECYE